MFSICIRLGSIGRSRRIFENASKQVRLGVSNPAHTLPLYAPFSSSWLPRKELRTIPNMITTARILASPLLTYCIVNDMKICALVGCVVFSLSDWLDGYLAKRLNQATTLGAFLDPVADKVMIAALALGLVYKGLLPVELMCIFIGRDVFLIAASFVMRGLRKPRDARFFDTVDSATFTLTPSDISKLNTALQFLLLGGTLGQFAFGVPSVAYLEPLWWITGTTTVWSGLGYLNGSGMKLLEKPRHPRP